MTCVVGFVDRGRVWIGADSCGSGGTDYHIRKDTKVFRNNNMIFGFTTSFRMGQLIQNSLKIPPHPVGMGDFKYLTTLFIDSVLECFKGKGFAAIKENVVSGGDFLVGYRKTLYVVYSDFQVGISSGQCDSVGCGYAYALGAMKVMEKENILPQEKIIRALKVSTYFSNAVKPPFRVVSLGGSDRNV